MTLVAKRGGLSTSGLRLLFRAELGISPSKYLKRLRLESARLMLCTELRSVKETMALVGFQDESHFVRDFEAIFGLSPLRYRRRYFKSAVQEESQVHNKGSA